MKKILILASLCALSISGVANAAQIGSYVGVSGTVNTIKKNNINNIYGNKTFKDNNLAGIQLSYGVNESRYLGYELSAGYIKGKNNTVKINNASARTKMNGYVVKADVVGYLPINNTVELYAKGGLAYGRVNIKINSGSGSDYSSDIGYNIGAGVMANLTPSISVKTGYDYTRFGKNKLGQIIIGMNYKI